MRKIFISYRRIDEIAAGRLGSDLRNHFGEDRVFRDKEDIGGGLSWRKEVLRAITKQSILLVLIGKDWANATDKHGMRRLNKSDDPLRLEITAALNEQAFIIPLLLQDAEMPSEEELPSELQALAEINALKLRDGDWVNDVDRICRTLAKAGFEPGSTVWPEAKEAETDNSSTRAPPVTEPGRQSLSEILPGLWQVQIQSPFAPGVIEQLSMEMFPAGTFRGQLASPMGVIAVEGRWQANLAMNQFALQGIRTNSFQTIPYVALVQVSSFDSRQIVGMTNVGEQVTWQRVNSPAMSKTGSGWQQPA